jgi:hypothetical protein
MYNYSEEAFVVPEAAIPDRRWLDGAVEPPKVGFMDQLRDSLSPAGLAMGYRVGVSVLKMVDNCKSSQPIPDGAELPIWEDKYDSMLKVIRDFRVLQRGFSPLANWGNIGDREKFDEHTRRMEKEKVYLGEPAKLNVMFDDDERATSLIRTVAYYLAAPSKKQLSGIASVHVIGCDVMPTPTALLPRLRVGATYKYGPRGTSKVVSAEILRPGDGRARKSKARRPKLLPTFSLLPKPALGTN